MLFTKELLAEFENKLQSARSIEDLVGKEGIIKKLLGHSIEKLMEYEMEEHLGYSKHSPEGNNSGNSRNGYKSKTLQSTDGQIEIDVPQDRNNTFQPVVVPKHSRRLGKIEDSIISLYAKGMSVSDIKKHLYEIYGASLSEASISMITGKVHEMVLQWQSRALETFYPVIFFDAIHYKVKDNGRVITKAAYTCLAITIEGYRDVLGIWIEENEGAHYWRNILAELNNRGIKDVLFVCVDGLKGFPEAIKSIFPKAIVQKCIIHQIRNAFKYVTSKDSKEFMNNLKQVYKAPSEKIALENLELLKNKWGKKYKTVVNSWFDNWEYLSPYLKFSENIRRIIYTTNNVENLHRQFRKVTGNKAVFTNDQALMKMLFLAQKELSDQWKAKVAPWNSVLAELYIEFGDRIPKLF